VTYAVSANEGSARTGRIDIAGKTITISQEPAPVRTTCDSYEVSPSAQSVTAKGGEFSLAVKTLPDCKWSATTSVSWIALRSSGGAGEGRVTYVVSANEGAARTGRIDVAGKTVTISQEPPPVQTCNSYEVSPSSQAVTAKGGEFALTVKTPADCKWGVTAAPSWITVRSGSGAGDGRVIYVVSANDGAARTGRIEVAGKTVTLSQEAPPRTEPTCTVTLSPSSQSVAIEGGVFSIRVSVDARCSWSAEGGAAWITFKSRSGTGPGEIIYIVDRHPGPARSAAITVSGQAVKVSQAGVR
jgi:hypothetical protein